jgi:hypothetical protein
MMLLEEVFVCGGVSFHPPCTSRVGEGIRVRVMGRRSARFASVLPNLLSVLDGALVKTKQGENKN